MALNTNSRLKRDLWPGSVSAALALVLKRKDNHLHLEVAHWVWIDFSGV